MRRKKEDLDASGWGLLAEAFSVKEEYVKKETPKWVVYLNPPFHYYANEEEHLFANYDPFEQEIESSS